MRSHSKKIPPDRGKTFSALFENILVSKNESSNEIPLSPMVHKNSYEEEEPEITLENECLMSLPLEKFPDSRVIGSSKDLDDSHVWL